ncbi:MAG: DUF6431 domain-containing protein [Peptococcales bacterium]|jgi:hypothetical protein
MQKIFKVNVSPDTYQTQDKSFPFPDLTHTLCPHCHKQHLRRHGFYRRYLIAKGFEGVILVRRYICPECGQTVSLLPWFCHPKRTYSMAFIHYSLSGFFGWTGTMVSFIRNFALDYGISFSRQLLYQYQKRILKNCSRILMDLVRQFHLDAPVSASMDNKKRVKDALNLIETAAPTPYSVSMDMFSHGSGTYLTLSAL